MKIYMPWAYGTLGDLFRLTRHRIPRQRPPCRAISAHARFPGLFSRESLRGYWGECGKRIIAWKIFRAHFEYKTKAQLNDSSVSYWFY